MNKVKSLSLFLSDLWKNKKTIIALAKNDFRAKFASSLLGVVWAFVQPLVTILVFWFVFEAGFRNPPVSGVPFIIWFTPSYLAWSFFSEALVTGSNCLVEYSYLVKKVSFRVSMIPIVKILSSAFVHIFFIGFIFIMMALNSVAFSIYNIQVIYYFLCTCVLLLGLCWLFSAITPFIKDTVNVVSVIIQIGFWLTPIFWTPETLAPWVLALLRTNPMYYICQGYRDTFILHRWFWEQGVTNLYFWSITVLLFFAGSYFFKRLRPQFADVL